MIIVKRCLLWGRFALDVFNCTKLIGNPIAAYRYLRGRKKNNSSFKFQSLCFKARKDDWIAIKEVLVEDEYGCIESIFSSNDTPRILDLGANIGSFAIRTYKHCNMAQVVSVEPANDTYQMLKQNQLLNPSINWKVLNYGVWSDDGPLTLTRQSISVSHRVIEGSGPDSVDGISIQSLVKKIGWDYIDLIKIDIEGGEEAVIPTAVDVLRKTKFLIIEIHNDRINPEPVISSLKSVYSFYWQINDRKSNKPVYVMSNELIPLGAQVIL